MPDCKRLQQLFLRAKRYVDGRSIDATRKVIVDAGYGEYFTHRTGHSIGTEIHANGATSIILKRRTTAPSSPTSASPSSLAFIYPSSASAVNSIVMVASGKAAATGRVQTELVTI